MAVSKSLFLSVLVFLIAVLTFIQLALASWLQDRLFTGPTDPPGTNQVTAYFVVVTLISAVVGIASLISASNSIQQWSKDLSGSDGATILIDLLLSFLALGYASKEIDVENNLPKHHRDGRVQTLEAFVIIVAAFKLIKVVILHTDFANKFFT